MSSSPVFVLSVALMVLGVLAEANLLRVVLRDWREGRREARERALVRRGERGIDRSCAPVIACVATLCAGGHALASVTQPFEPQTTANASAEAATSSTIPASTTLTIATDRPSFSDTAGIVPPGHLQLETGYTFTFRDRQGVETQRHNAPEVLARVGLVDDRLELRLSTSGYVWSRSDDGSGAGFTSAGGWSDVSVGLKLKLTDQDGALPRLALGAATTVGAGSQSASSRRAEPLVKLIWSYDLQKLLGDDFAGFGVYGNLNLGWPTSDGERFLQGAASICSTYAITDRLGVFAEYYAVFPATKGTGPAHSIDLGASYLLTPRVQLDARVGFGLSDRADNVFTGFGVSVLF